MALWFFFSTLSLNFFPQILSEVSLTQTATYVLIILMSQNVMSLQKFLPLLAVISLRKVVSRTPPRSSKEKSRRYSECFLLSVFCLLIGYINNNSHEYPETLFSDFLPQKSKSFEFLQRTETTSAKNDHKLTAFRLCKKFIWL